jgi:2,3-bisphosphoglycerate-dependent phosphoglycerate mutase
MRMNDVLEENSIIKIINKEDDTVYNKDINIENIKNNFDILYHQIKMPTKSLKFITSIKKNYNSLSKLKEANNNINLPLQAIQNPIKLVLVRHGESEWNKLNIFTGWTDVPLSEKGHEEAIHCGKLLKEGHFKFDICYTSVLNRAIHTSFHILDELGQLYIPIVKNFHLNERHYGALQGLKKKEIAEIYGSDLVKALMLFDIPPPPLEENDERNPVTQSPYKNTAKKYLPLGESIKDTFARVVPFYNDVIIPDIAAGKKILIVAHDISLKVLVKYIDNISDKEIVDIMFPTGVPLVYELDQYLKPINQYYLGIRSNVSSDIGRSSKKKNTFSNNFYDPYIRLGTIDQKEINDDIEKFMYNIKEKKVYVPTNYIGGNKDLIKGTKISTTTNKLGCGSTGNNFIIDSFTINTTKGKFSGITSSDVSDSFEDKLSTPTKGVKSAPSSHSSSSKSVRYKTLLNYGKLLRVVTPHRSEKIGIGKSNTGKKVVSSQIKGFQSTKKKKKIISLGSKMTTDIVVKKKKEKKKKRKR